MQIMQTFLVLLRGINVGGANKLPMADLRECLEKADFHNVRTYIQSGNVFVDSDITDIGTLETTIQQAIDKTFGLSINVVALTHDQWKTIIGQAPKWWGHDLKNWKYNLLVMLHPYDMPAVAEAYGELKPDIENMALGEGVVYQALSWNSFGKTTGGKLASNPLYRKMTVRNYNTAQKLLGLF